MQEYISFYGENDFCINFQSLVLVFAEILFTVSFARVGSNSVKKLRRHWVGSTTLTLEPLKLQLVAPNPPMSTSLAPS